MTGADYARLGERAEELAVFDGHQAFMRMQQGHCAALVLDPESREFRCDAYLVRPDVCRDLARLSPSCDAERMQKAERALSALRRSR